MLIAVLWLRLSWPRPPKLSWCMLGVLLGLTIVFDSLIIWAEIVAYDYTKILGVFLIRAPIEDFFYSVFAILLVSSLWHKFAKKESE